MVVYQTIARIAPSASAPRGRDFTELDTRSASARLESSPDRRSSRSHTSSSVRVSMHPKKLIETGAPVCSRCLHVSVTSSTLKGPATLTTSASVHGFAYAASTCPAPLNSSSKPPVAASSGLTCRGRSSGLPPLCSSRCSSTHYTAVCRYTAVL